MGWLHAYDQLQPHNFANVLRPLWLEKPETASRIKQRLHAIMGWGWARGYCSSNPVDVVEHLLPVQPGKRVRTIHHPAMLWREIPEFWVKHLNNVYHDTSRAILKFIILTACRSGEARGATWEEFDLDARIWTVPAHRMKAKAQHRVPLAAPVLLILKKQKELCQSLVFPSNHSGKQLTDMTITMLLRRLNAPSDTKGRCATAHGFRSSFRDWCSENGYARDLAERALAHTIPNQTEAAYHRSDLLEQRRSMMEKWADYVTSRTTAADSSQTIFFDPQSFTKK